MHKEQLYDSLKSIIENGRLLPNIERYHLENEIRDSLLCHYNLELVFVELYESPIEIKSIDNLDHIIVDIYINNKSSKEAVHKLKLDLSNISISTNLANNDWHYKLCTIKVEDLIEYVLK